MKRYLPFVIIAGVLIVLVVGYFAFLRQRLDNSAPFAVGANPPSTIPHLTSAPTQSAAPPASPAERAATRPSSHADEPPGRHFRDRRGVW